MMSVPCAWAKLVPSAANMAAALVAAVALSRSRRVAVPSLFWSADMRSPFFGFANYNLRFDPETPTPVSQVSYPREFDGENKDLFVVQTFSLHVQVENLHYKGRLLFLADDAEAAHHSVGKPPHALGVVGVLELPIGGEGLAEQAGDFLGFLGVIAAAEIAGFAV